MKSSNKETSLVLNKVRTLKYFDMFDGFHGGEMQRIVTRRESPRGHVEMIEEERFQWQRE